LARRTLASGTTAAIGLASIFAGNGSAEGPLEEEAGIAESKINAAADAIEGWLGEGYQKFESETSDLALRSENWTRRVRFDLTNPHGLAPHVNVETWALRNLYPGDRRWVLLSNQHIFLP
jgi:hypothetical protein